MVFEPQLVMEPKLKTISHNTHAQSEVWFKDKVDNLVLWGGKDAWCDQNKADFVGLCFRWVSGKNGRTSGKTLVPELLVNELGTIR